MKKLLILILVFLTGFSVIPIKAQASSSATTMMLDKINYSFVVGSEFNVTVMVQNVSNLGMWWLELGFDPNIIEYKRFYLPPDNVFAGNSIVIASTGPWVVNDTLSAGVALGEPNGTEFNGSGKLITLVFFGKNAGATSLNFMDKGQWTIMTDNSIFQHDIPFDVINSTAHSILCFGDVNGDGLVDMKDVSQAVAAFNSFVGAPRWNMYADVDGNGYVNMKDIVAIVLNFGARA